MLADFHFHHASPAMMPIVKHVMSMMLSVLNDPDQIAQLSVISVIAAFAVGKTLLAHDRLSFR